jgi:hypothetical protein
MAFMKDLPGQEQRGAGKPADISYHDMLEVPDRSVLYPNVTPLRGCCPDEENVQMRRIDRARSGP